MGQGGGLGNGDNGPVRALGSCVGSPRRDGYVVDLLGVALIDAVGLCRIIKSAFRSWTGADKG